MINGKKAKIDFFIPKNLKGLEKIQDGKYILEFVF
jgi:hypothetical protein